MAQDKKARAEELRKKKRAAELRAKQTLSSQQAQATTPEDQPSQLEALGRGAAQGATLGFADEISAGAGAVFDSVGDFVKGDLTTEEFLERYKTGLEESRANFEASEQAFPKTSIAGSIGGAIAGGAVGKGLGLASKLGSAATGALTGGAFGAGSSEGTLAEGLEGAQEIAGDIAAGAATGGVLGAVAGPKGLGKLEKAVQQKLQSSPREFMQKMNFNKNAFRSSSGGKQSAEKAVESLQKKGILPSTKEELARLGPEDIQKSLSTERARLGGAIGAAIDKADDVLPDIGVNRLGLGKLSKDIKELKKAGFDADVNLALDEVEIFLDGAANINRAKDLWQGKKIIDQALHTMTKKLDPSALEKTKVRSLFNARSRVKSQLDDLIEEVSRKDPTIKELIKETGRNSFKEINEDFANIASIGRFVDDAAASAAKTERSFGQAVIDELSAPSGGVAGGIAGGVLTGSPVGAGIGAGIGAAAKAAARAGILERGVVGATEAARSGVRGVARGISGTLNRDVNIATKIYQTYNPEDSTINSPEEVKVHIGNVMQNTSLSHADKFREVNRVQKTGQINPSLISNTAKRSAAKELDKEDQMRQLDQEAMFRALNELRGI